MAKEHKNLMEEKIVSKLCASEGIISYILFAYLFMLPWNLSYHPFMMCLFLHFFFQLVYTRSSFWPSLACRTKDFYFFLVEWRTKKGASLQLAMNSSGEVCVMLIERDEELCLEKMLVLTLWSSINIKETMFQTTILNPKSLLKIDLL